MTLVDQQALKQKIISLLDLTHLETDLTAGQVIELCKRAVTPLGNVAAVCIPLPFVALAKQQLQATNILVATVANFPSGNQSLAAITAEIEAAITAQADEIDIVIPYHGYLTHDSKTVSNYLSHYVKTCKGRIRLKVILETGELKSQELILQASLAAIKSGVDFIKTSTGKTPVGATLAAAEIMLTAIKNTAKKPVGFKASGGIRTMQQAMQYLTLAETIMPPQWVRAEHFRFGASSLLTELLSDTPQADNLAGHY